jgi:hypothetical protein
MQDELGYDFESNFTCITSLCGSSDFANLAKAKYKFHAALFSLVQFTEQVRSGGTSFPAKTTLTLNSCCHSHTSTEVYEKRIYSVIQTKGTQIRYVNGIPIYRR